MDDYALHRALEALANNSYNPEHSPTGPPEPMYKTISRWHTLFNIPEDEAVDRIIAHRDNLTRTRISDSHWEIVQAEKESLGYDREAYEYELDLQRKRALLPDLLPAAEGGEDRVTYLVELTGPLKTAEDVQRVAGLTKRPEVVGGNSVESNREVRLCCINDEAKKNLLRWAASKVGGFEPTILVNPKSLR